MEEIVKKTGYEWCLEANIRLLDLNEWGKFFGEAKYFLEKISLQEFYKNIEECSVITNTKPLKTEPHLEYRMYGLVPYNISPIQQAIQFGHAVVDYGQTVKGFGKIEKKYNTWANRDKTFIILNGGTTNNNPECLGTLNKHLNALNDAGVLVQSFHEPDLGDQLTAVVFLIDERVFNKTLYPDFVPEELPYSTRKPSDKAMSQLEARNSKAYAEWEKEIGGPVNAFLREYLKPLRLA
jgi:hypothetical protein